MITFLIFSVFLRLTFGLSGRFLLSNTGDYGMFWEVSVYLFWIWERQYLPARTSVLNSDVSEIFSMYLPLFSEFSARIFP